MRRKKKKKKLQFRLTSTAGLFGALYPVGKKKCVPQLPSEQPRSRLLLKLISKTFAMRAAITWPSLGEIPKTTSTVCRGNVLQKMNTFKLALGWWMVPASGGFVDISPPQLPLCSEGHNLVLASLSAFWDKSLHELLQGNVYVWDRGHLMGTGAGDWFKFRLGWREEVIYPGLMCAEGCWLCRDWLWEGWGCRALMDRAAANTERRELMGNIFKLDIRREFETLRQQRFGNGLGANAPVHLKLRLVQSVKWDCMTWLPGNVTGRTWWLKGALLVLKWVLGCFSFLFGAGGASHKVLELLSCFDDHGNWHCFSGFWHILTDMGEVSVPWLEKYLPWVLAHSACGMKGCAFGTIKCSILTSQWSVLLSHPQKTRNCQWLIWALPFKWGL